MCSVFNRIARAALLIKNLLPFWEFFILPGRGETLEEVFSQSESSNPRLAELMSRFRYSEGWRKQYDETADECHKLYIGYRKPNDSGRSNLHIPRTYEEIDTIRARLVKSFFTTRPYMDFIPMPSTDATPETMQQNGQKAELAASLLDMQFEKNGIIRTFYDYVTSFLVYPAAFMAVGWRYDTKVVQRKVTQMVTLPIMNPMTGQPMALPITQQVEQEAVIWDDNEITHVDFKDIFPDPRAKSLDNSRFLFHREFLTKEQIESKLEALKEADGENVYTVDWESVTQAGETLEEGRWSRDEEVGLSPETTQGFNNDKGQKGILFETLHYWTDDEYSIIINRCSLAYDGKNPYQHGKIPYVMAVFEPIPDSFYGLSAVQIIQHLQAELNTTRNQRIDNVSLVLNRMWKVRRSADVDESELVSRPHGVIHVDSNDDVTEFAMNDVTSSSYNEENIIKSDMENALGVPAVVRGVSPNQRETATEVVTKSSNASIRFDVKILIYEAMGFKRLAMLCDINNQQFIDNNRLVRIYGQDGPNMWRMVQPDDILGEWDYRPSGANVDPASNKEYRRQQLTQLMSMALQLPMVNKYELVKMWLECFDIRNVDRILYSEQEMQIQQMQAQQAQQQQQMMAQAQQPQGITPDMVKAILSANQAVG